MSHKEEPKVEAESPQAKDTSVQWAVNPNKEATHPAEELPKEAAERSTQKLMKAVSEETWMGPLT